MKRGLFSVICALIIEAIICCSEPKKAHASPSNPALGGCISCQERNDDGTCRVCNLSAHPTVVQPLTAIDLKTATLLYGLGAVSPGICYGITVGPDAWYASGGFFCLNTAHTEQGNLVFPSGIIQVAKWGQGGIGAMCNDGKTGSLVCHAVLMFGIAIPVE